jgi:anti-sigma factor RsiW
MNCRDLDPLLAPYVDGDPELHDAAAVDIDAHLRACSPCRDKLAAQRAAHDVLHARAARLRVCAPDDLHRRCAAQAAASTRSRPLLRRSLIPLSLAATLLLAVAGVFVFGINDRVQALAGSLALDHKKCFQLAPDHATVDAATAARDWAARQGWTLAVPETAPGEQLELLDVRRCLSTLGLSAHIMYRWRGRPLSVFVMKGAPARRDSLDRYVEVLGEDAVLWTSNGRTYAVVGRAPRADLQQVARYVRVHVNGNEK